MDPVANTSGAASCAAYQASEERPSPDALRRLFVRLGDALADCRRRVDTTPRHVTVTEMLRSRCGRAAIRVQESLNLLERGDGSCAALERAQRSLDDLRRRHQMVEHLLRIRTPDVALQMAIRGDEHLSAAWARFPAQREPLLGSLADAFERAMPTEMEEQLVNLLLCVTALTEQGPTSTAETLRPRPATPRRTAESAPEIRSLPVAAEGAAIWKRKARDLSRELQVMAHTIDESFPARLLLCVTDPAPEGTWTPRLSPDRDQAIRAQRASRLPGNVRRDVLIAALGGGDRVVELFEEVTAAYLAGQPMPRYLRSYCEGLLGRLSPEPEPPPLD
ncbi:hypothetical protein CDL60_05485 [Roseateles noduli]|nr:hypothetical protein CDL60_05485 [Roseateles noduli]